MNDPWQIEYWITSQSGMIHAITAIGGLVFGPIIFARIKGNRSHRTLGFFWLTMMLITNIGALTTFELGNRPNVFHFFALVNLATIAAAFYYIQKYKSSRERIHLENHLEYMAWAYFGLAAAGVWQIVISLMRIGAIPISYTILVSGLSALTAILAFGLFALLRTKFSLLEKSNYET